MRQNPNYCDSTVVSDYFNTLVKESVNFAPYKIDVADGYVVYLYTSSGNPYAIFTRGNNQQIDSSSFVVDGSVITTVAYITIEYESTNGYTSKLEAPINDCVIRTIQEPTPIPTPQPNTTSIRNIIVYQHCGYGGYAVTLSPGVYSLSKLQSLGIRNDDLSSIRIQPGFVAYLFEHGDFEGKCLITRQDIDCFVSLGFNDIVSSIIVSNQADPFVSSGHVVESSYACFRYTLSKSAILQKRHGSYNTSLDNRASWIWNTSNATSNAATGSITIEQEIVHNKTETLYLHIIVDDRFSNMILNQKIIQAGESGNWDRITTISLPIKKGINLLSFQARNGGGPAGVIFVVQDRAGNVIARSGAGTKTS